MARAAPLENHWDDAHAASLDEPGRLLYRSNLLGADKRITNYGGGNTSAKLQAKDPLTGEAGDRALGQGLGRRSGLDEARRLRDALLDKLERLKGLYRGIEHEDEMVGFLPHCTFDLNPRAASIDTPLHAYLPYRHVDHVHPDAVIAIAASARSRGADPRGLRRRDRLAALAAAGLRARAQAGGDRPRQPAPGRLRARRARAVHLGRGRQGLLRDHAADHPAGAGLAGRQQPRRCVRRGARRGAARGGAHGRGAAAAAPAARADRGRRAQGRPCRHVAGGAGVRRTRNRLEELAALGTSCPDHFLRTKIRPLVCRPTPTTRRSTR